MAIRVQDEPEPASPARRRRRTDSSRAVPAAEDSESHAMAETYDAVEPAEVASIGAALAVSLKLTESQARWLDDGSAAWGLRPLC